MLQLFEKCVFEKCSRLLLTGVCDGRPSANLLALLRPVCSKSDFPGERERPGPKFLGTFGASTQIRIETEEFGGAGNAGMGAVEREGRRGQHGALGLRDAGEGRARGGRA